MTHSTAINRTRAPQPAAEALQPTLSVGPTNDPMERQADAVAENVVGIINTCSSISKSALSEVKDLSSAKAGIQTESLDLGSNSAPKQEAAKATPAIESGIQSSRGSGMALPDPTKQFMEARMGADFSSVRVHTDSKAASLNRQLGAKAFTVGNDIWFNSGQFAPSSREGKKLLAHELTHTLQQGGDAQTTVQRESETIQMQQAPCPTTLSREDPIPPGFIPYYGDPAVFHCGFYGIKEDRSPTGDALQNECFYDENNQLVDQHHPYTGCGGTPNRWDSEGLSGLLHATIDPGGIVRAGPGAFVTSRLHDVVTAAEAIAAPVVAVGQMLDSAASSFAEQLGLGILTGFATLNPTNWSYHGLNRATRVEINKIALLVYAGVSMAESGNKKLEIAGTPLYEFVDEATLDSIADGINQELFSDPVDEGLRYSGYEIGEMSMLDLVDLMQRAGIITFNRNPEEIAREQMEAASTQEE